ncbi:hypothetical protein RF11_13846 [Thelohanellus kitauei]|uniref:Uncharacterized protein n=1 Tax=Thelohanellus kitauei TaxID=669202 RepID=A0A0C2M5Y6_THEKT|nr:hypothetical protein RF11_13846 [Thelohanellus kitauei]
MQAFSLDKCEIVSSRIDFPAILSLFILRVSQRCRLALLLPRPGSDHINIEKKKCYGLRKNQTSDNLRIGTRHAISLIPLPKKSYNEYGKSEENTTDKLLGEFLWI